ncbi:hypothetical protein BJY01DRAFT_255636 [Aspergillus pseudoustus]|uniref:Heterokaryon incompatibility domain-containing protein n=1 Tax=Aspergillus pseudoustus TaxID=1810923 RepID=A0ABR4IIR0_9EURO
MSKTLLDFATDVDNGFLSDEQFYQGLFNLWEQVMLHSTPLHNGDLQFDLHTKRQDLKDNPETFGAFCFRELFKRPMLARTVAFSYESSTTQDDNQMANLDLVFGLGALARDLVEPADETDSPDQYTFTYEEVQQYFVVAAFYSARSPKQLEPLDELPPATATQGEAEKGVPGIKQDNTTPIGEMIESLFSHELQLDESCGPCKRGLERWFFLLHPGNFERLQPHLSLEQANITRILLEWWDGSTDLEANAEQSRAAVRQLSAVDEYEEEDLENQWGYQRDMQSLLGFEFLREFDRPTFIAGYRQICAQAAAAQRLAAAVCSSLSDQRSFSQQPHDISTETKGPACNRSIGASLSPCAWLPQDVAHTDMPYYLWDVQKRRTYVTKELNERVQYTAISHTWGRWKNEDAPWVPVQGAEEWLIPQNTKFNVTDLPNILESAPVDTRFVWFDLLCIPQEPESAELKQIARNEIARQATIFRGATHAIAWLNDVDGWEGLHAVLRILSIKYMSLMNELPSWMLDLANADPEVRLELASYPEMSKSGELNGWFSSLWTLQELCLRPDMILCDRLWNVFAVRGSKETAVRLDDLVALRRKIPDERLLEQEKRDTFDLFGGDVTENDCPPVIEGLDYLFLCCALIGFPNVSREAILSMGGQRYCQANRAEAIMSAIGAVDWYSSAMQDISDSPESHPPFPANGYPQAFLQEVADKVGPQFYAANIPGAGLIPGLLRTLKSNPGTIYQGPGTMLPFGFDRYAKIHSIVASNGIPNIAHPSVKTWRINTDLSVDIHQVSIISYTGQVRSVDREILADIHAPPPGTSFSKLEDIHQPDTDLDHWVDNYLPKTRNFAVCLCYGRQMDGILLKELATGDLVKIGSFWYTPDRLVSVPKTYKVDWHVL